MSLSCAVVARAFLGEPHHCSGAEAFYHCPCHEDKHPSLKINQAKDVFLCGPCGTGGNGWRLAAFFARVTPNEKKAVALWLKEHGIEQNGNGAAAKEKKPKAEPGSFREVASFYYSPTLRNVRFEAPPANGGKPEKKFQFQRSDNGKWVPGAGGQPIPLYMNELMREADMPGMAVGFEGEAKCEEANKLGIPGFSFKHSAATEYVKLADMDVVIWPDADPPGEKQAKTFAKSLFDCGHARSIRIVVPPPELPLSGDIVDAVKMGWPRKVIDALISDAPEYPPKPKPVTIRLSDVQAEKVTWLWHNRIPAGAITILDGDPGTGKSMLCVDVAARVSKGEPFPGESHRNEPASVIFLSSEDSLSQTLVPRLRAAGANLSKIVTIPYIPETPGQQTFSRIPKDLEMLGNVIEQEKAKLVIFDVLVSYIPAELSTQKDQDVRLALSPLSMLCNRTGASCIATRHLNKNTQGPALYRGGGSIAIVGAARCSLLLARSPENTDTRVLAVNKSNLGIIPPATTFTIITEQGIPRIDWLGESEHKAETLLAQQSQTPGERSTAPVLRDVMETLEGLLSDGPMKYDEIVQTLRDSGCGASKRTVDQAKAELGIKSVRTNGAWWWDMRRKKWKN